MAYTQTPNGHSVEVRINKKLDDEEGRLFFGKVLVASWTSAGMWPYSQSDALDKALVAADRKIDQLGLVDGRRSSREDQDDLGGNSVINAIKRLQRIGDVNSPTNQKLMDATDKAVDFLLKAIGRPCSLPRDYVIFKGGDGLRLRMDHDGNPRISEDWERNEALRFAEDIASGWLEEVLHALNSEVEDACSALAEVPSRYKAMGRRKRGHE